MTTTNAEAFRAFVKEVTGFDPGPIQLTPQVKKYRRFSTSTDPHDRSGAYYFHGEDGRVCNFRVSKEWIHWLADREFTEAELEAIEERKRAELAQAEEISELAVKKLRSYYGRLKFKVSDPQTHPYLEKKDIRAPNLFVDKGSLIIPLYDKKNELANLQMMDPRKEKSKLFFTGAFVPAELHFIFGEIVDKVIIAEGFATAATLHEATGWPAVMAVTVHKLNAVTQLIRKRYPNAEIIIGADDDVAEASDHIGERYALAAAKRWGAKVSLPTFDRDRLRLEDPNYTDKAYSDWNDFARVNGKDKVTNLFFKNAIVPDAEEEAVPTTMYIDYVEGREADILEQIERFIVDNKVPIYHRANKLVRPRSREYPTYEPEIMTTVSAFHVVNHINLVKAMAKYGLAFRKRNERTRKYKIIDTPKAVTSNLLEDGDWDYIHECIGIINTPTLRPDGSLLFEEGYDPSTKLYLDLDISLDMPELKAYPTKEDAAEAIKLFIDLLSEFPFEDLTRGNEKESVDLACALAAILTAITRPAYRKAVMILVAAHVASSGKSYLVNVISKLLQGRAAPVVGFGRTPEEAEKQLDSLLLDGVPCFSMDNLTKDIDGQKICQMFTEEVMRVRRLGSTDMFDCDSRTTVFATGNNVNFVNDMIRRGITIHLNATEERPEQRKFKLRPDQVIIKERGKYVAAALTIVRAYLVSGDKVSVTPLASFEEWCRFCREPLIWLGYSDPIKSQDTAREDASSTDWRPDFIAYLYSAFAKEIAANQGFRTNQVTSHFNDLSQASDEKVIQATLLKSLVGDGRVIDSQRLGTQLKHLVGKVCSYGPEDQRLKLRFDKLRQANDNTSLWTVTKLEDKPEVKKPASTTVAEVQNDIPF